MTLSETLHGELAALGSKVGVSVLCPGFVSTRLWESDRNRPEALQNPDPHGTEQEREEGRALLRALIEGSMPAEDVADQVLDAVLNQRFYVLTHENTDAAVEKRMQRILRNENPMPPEGGPAILLH